MFWPLRYKHINTRSVHQSVCEPLAMLMYCHLFKRLLYSATIKLPTWTGSAKYWSVFMCICQEITERVALLSNGIQRHGWQSLYQNGVKLVLNETNPELFQIRFQYILALRSSGFVPFGYQSVSLSAHINLIFLVWVEVYNIISNAFLSKIVSINRYLDLRDTRRAGS